MYLYIFNKYIISLKQAATTEKTKDKTTTGYDIPIPKQPLTLPTKRTTTAARTTVTEATAITTPTETKPGTIAI